jgi:hypothetical protein
MRRKADVRKSSTSVTCHSRPNSLLRGTVPIPGTRRIKYLEENVAATDITMTEDEVKALDAAAYVSSIEASNSNIIGGGATGVIPEP